ncbi:MULTISPECIES: hypothetical protein [Bacillus]|uniref:Ferric oxidoreductase domain-containing protein n=1 Tax=Bacillus cereus VD048 TaxID=1053226 RepID=J8I7V3_BACCE|nr:MULTISPECIES: hypothetical protein [Bacillus]EEK73138.1 hypothetical protein bcere0007_24520 [Bacillus mycoides]EJR33581.1 hypothetical protein IIG_02253 [Bacillus cereus VD048]MBK5429580.1 hypothetical protein [Bacillus sp. TH30]WJE37266.1 hypothetical protein QRX95_13305 [Bacillus mycoides]WOA65958.1 hypothetical protein RVY75_13195 [Bacillus mycoides]
MEKILRNKYFHIYVKIIGITIIICSVELLFINILYGNVLNIKWLNKQLGSFGEYGAIIAASLWFLRHIWLFLKKKHIHGFKIIKELYLFIKHFHVLIGYAVIAVATTHGGYFLIKGSRHIILIYSGIFSLLTLITLGVAGFVLQKSNQKTKLKMYRKAHQIIAVIFGIGLLIHLIV